MLRETSQLGVARASGLKTSSQLAAELDVLAACVVQVPDECLKLLYCVFVIVSFSPTLLNLTSL